MSGFGRKRTFPTACSNQESEHRDHVDEERRVSLFLRSPCCRGEPGSTEIRANACSGRSASDRALVDEGGPIFSAVLQPHRHGTRVSALRHRAGDRCGSSPTHDARPTACVSQPRAGTIRQVVHPREGSRNFLNIRRGNRACRSTRQDTGALTAPATSSTFTGSPRPITGEPASPLHSIPSACMYTSRIDCSS
jgi:hypothetical protein